MRCLTIVALLLTVTVTCCGPGPSVTAEPTASPPEDGELEHKVTATPEAPTLTPTCSPGPSATTEPTEPRIPPTATEAPTLTPTAVDTMTPAPKPSEEPTTEGPLLRMVRIRARSSLEVRQLRQMHLVDVVSVRPDPDRPPGDELQSGGFIVEAVVTLDILNALKAKGFEVSEIPPPEK